MAKKNTLSTELIIYINGSKIQDSIRSQVVEAVVDQHVHIPDMFTIRMQDPDTKILDDGPFDLTKEIAITAGDAENKKTLLMNGEITALEPYFGKGMVPELIVRGYDKSHRLYRETKSRAFLNKKDSQLAQELAKEIGLSAKVDSTSTVYDHIYQSNQSNLAFLMERAWRIGYECYVDGGKLYFRKPPQSPPSVTLQWGEDLLSFQPRMTLAEQVDEVQVKGWDVDQLKAITGKSKSGKLYPKIDESKNGATWAETFGNGKMVIVDQPVISQAEANALATARLNELSGAFVQAAGVAFRHPEIKAGKMVELKLLGKRFSGKYLVTNATHVYDSEGFRTNFYVRGSRTGLLSENITHKPPLMRWPGVVSAIVTNTEDPKKWGRVKVKYPWLSDDAESDWARVIGAGAGPDAGFCIIPDVGDEVLVAFGQADFSQPFVLGGLWNGRHGVPPELDMASQNERPLVRTWHSRSGHAITMYDNSDNKIDLISAGGHTISIDDAGSKIEVKSSGGLTITMDDNGRKIEVKSNGDMELKAGKNLKLEATANIDIKASGQVNIKGAMINLN